MRRPPTRLRRHPTMQASRLFAALSLALVAACSKATQSGEGTASRGDTRTVTAADLSASTQTNLYDYVAANRPRWLQSRAPGNLGGQSLSVVVFLNSTRLGGPDQLKSISLPGVRQIRYYDAAEAQQRFNVRDAGAVIQVTTN